MSSDVKAMTTDADQEEGIESGGGDGWGDGVFFFFFFDFRVTTNKATSPPAISRRERELKADRISSAECVSQANRKTFQIFQKSRQGRCDGVRLFGAPHHDACSPVHQRFPAVRRREGR